LADAPNAPSAPSAPSAKKKTGFFALSLLANHFPQLHGVRVLAVVLVVQFHVTFALLEGKLPIDPGWGTLSATVFFGMDLFFVLSGFLIGTMILHSLDQSSRQNVGRFYARRSFRIFPLYYVTLTALLFLYPLTVWQKQTLIYEYLYLTNYQLVLRNTVVMMWGWSLCVEEHFYLAVPGLMAVLNRLRSHRSRLTLLVALWASALGVRLFIYASHPGQWDEQTLFQAFYIKTHTRYDTLVAGILLAYLQHNFREPIRRLLAHRGARAALWVVVLGCLFTLLTPHSFSHYFIIRLLSWGTLTSLMYVPFLLMIMNVESGMSRWLSSPFFLKVATLGYGIYLWHIPVCEKVMVPLAQVLHTGLHVSMGIVWVLTLALLLVASTGVAYLTHIFIEKPALWLRDRFAP
jgi:peptidoglycan/LPS O-acetylase OafA/YrhL